MSPADHGIVKVPVNDQLSEFAEKAYRLSVRMIRHWQCCQMCSVGSCKNELSKCQLMFVGSAE